MESEAKTVVLVSPALAESNNGNWHTAHRWAQFLSAYCDTALLKLWRSKTRVIYQSARALKPAQKSSRTFRALMVGHLREEKDPLTYMKAAQPCL